MTASVRETHLWRIQITPQHDSFKTRITPKYGYRNQIANLQAQHIRRSKSYSCVAEFNPTLITLITILDEGVGYHFCQVTVAQPESSVTDDVIDWPIPKKLLTVLLPGNPIILSMTIHDSMYEI